MTLELAKVVSSVDNPLFSKITCLDSWRDKLIVGTEDQGVIVVNTVLFPGQKDKYNSAAESRNNCTQKDGEPIKQLSVFQEHGLIAVLTDGKVSIYELNVSFKLEFKFVEILPFKNVMKFSSCGDSICLGCPADFVILKFNGNKFDIVGHFPCKTYVPRDFLITSDVVYVAYRLPYSEVCGIYDRTSREFKHNVFGSKTNLALLGHMNEEEIVLQLDNKSVTSIVKKEKLITNIFWLIAPTKIVATRTYSIGISGDSIEMIPNDWRHQRFSQTFELPSRLKYITPSGSSIFVASTDSIWHLNILPADSDSLSSSKRSYLYADYHTQSEDSPHTSPPDSPRFSSPQPSSIPSIYRTPQYETPIANVNIFTDALDELEGYPLPVGFSPDEALTCLGLRDNEVERILNCGISTVQQFAEITMTEMALNFNSTNFLAARKLAKHYMQLHEKNENQIKAFAPPPPRQNNPEDPLEVIGMATEHIQYFASQMVFTVRQFATMSHIPEELAELHEAAKLVVTSHSSSSTLKKAGEIGGTVYGYMYLTMGELASVLEYREIKSAYVLFQEYMQLEPEIRFEHPWREVYQKYYHRVKHETHSTSVSDVDVFSYLCWRHLSSVGKLDYTAGSRAIFFHLKRIPASMSNLTRDLYGNVARINLTALCKQHGGKLFFKRLAEWEPAKLEQTESYANVDTSTLEDPWGCIVLASGTISWDHFTITTQ